ncbi:MAG: NUDIX domain-containing protein [Acidiferrobacterales bacterium]
MDLKAHAYSDPHPAVTTDIVIFSIRDEKLKLLLVERAREPFAGAWALPGGFIGHEEDLETCALRALEEETGVSGVYLEQLHTWGRPNRDPRGRVISIAYYALIPSDRLSIRPASDAKAVAWSTLDQLPDMAFDHADIVTMAHRRLVAKLDYSTIAFQFMPETFTLSELQTVYEIILGERLDKRNFRKRVLALDRIESTGALRRNGNHRPARLYRLKFPDKVEIIK